ncbi:hypothetical protein HCH_04445 [Hahella chejuensis KCTC 2396]|uniref:Uncharacterized protein n=1 Tax=Hahella chejuensis (strain KCTC 2396) TaxID=349521 RepID=Q2SDX5_HAHCH|nr:hypothetical protein HCH_04445 [Hahella chejuensis KCTC 2396]
MVKLTPISNMLNEILQIKAPILSADGGFFHV